MSRGLIAEVRRANKTRVPEDSIALRASVLIAVLLGTTALALEQAISPAMTMLVAGGLCFAYWLSYRRRAADNWHIKILLALCALLALVRFFVQIGGIATLDEARFPLAEVFLWVQVLHGFDLPARRDLMFSLGASVALVAIAASLSQDLGFALVLAIYLLVALFALVLAHRSETAQGAVAVVRSAPVATASPTRRWSRDLIGTAATALCAGALLFLLIPQPTSARSFALPFTLGPASGSLSSGAIVNPDFSGDASSRSAAASYYGLAERMDLRVRGALSDDLVMRVRSSAPALWKGALFDTYDGLAWTGDESDPTELAGAAPYLYPPAFRSLGPRVAVTQTYYLESEQPNAIFAAGQPDEVWFDGGVSVDALGGLRTASTLTPGTVYSVVSTRGAATPAQLRGAPHEAAPEMLSRYLQVPDRLPSRVSAVAERVTQEASSDYDKVIAIESFLRAHYRYTVDSPVPPPGRDAVDHFLFDAKVGFCEQFASALAVMLRTLDIPTRVVTGYAMGRRNIFTGYYEVRASDAHAWVEVWFPRFGWYEFDPTLDVPPATTNLGQSLPLARVIRFVTEKLQGGGSKLAWLLRGLLAVAVGTTLTWAAIVVRSRLVRNSQRRSSRPAGETRGDPLGRAFARLERALADRGAGRAAAETARELVVRTADPVEPRTREAVEIFERERYALERPLQTDVARAAEELHRLAGAVLEGTTAPPSRPQRGAR